jgi:hypothetical protein
MQDEPLPAAALSFGFRNPPLIAVAKSGSHLAAAAKLLNYW